jgi:hypothetical protein
VIVEDTEEEVALALLPGAECLMPEGYVHGRLGARHKWNRWDDYLQNNYRLEQFIWHTNRLLILLKPQDYYATIYFWNNSSGEFLCYYINFQLPFWRSACGFDTLDLELDVVIQPSFEWRWKDAEDYQDGIQKGVLLKQWTDGISQAKDHVLQKIERREYPLNGQWLGWRPDPAWPAANLPANWEEM